MTLKNAERSVCDTLCVCVCVFGNCQVQVCQARSLKKVQLLGKQDPYVRAKLYLDGHVVSGGGKGEAKGGGVGRKTGRCYLVVRQKSTVCLAQRERQTPPSCILV